MANVLGTLFGNIASAIREKTGETGTMKPAEFPDKIKEIEVGGGAIEGVHTVTFMSEDGSSVLYERLVVDGDDCANVVDRGLLDAPTKESTAQYEYTYSGWSLTSGGAADANALKSVTADRTVYAAFASAVRYYTITYYDGDTVLKTESLPYGSMPSYKPTKDDYDFVAWTPAPVAVTGDASYSAAWQMKAAFETATWEQIAEICDSGRAADTFKVGDAKPVTLTYDNGTSETINFRIVDMSVDHVSKTEKASLTIMADNIVSISPTTLASSYKNHSRNLHEMDTASAFLDKIFSAMPSELQSVIKPYWISELVAGYPKLTNIFVAHSVNLGVSHDGFGNQDTPNYNETYKYFADGASIKRTKLTNASFDDYWTSAVVNWQSGSYYKYCYLAIDGTARMNAGQIPDSNSHGIVPCFCI